MTPRQEALAAMKAEVQQMKLEAYDYAVYLANPTTELTACGYRGTREEAVAKSLADTQKSIVRLYKLYEMKYPD